MRSFLYPYCAIGGPVVPLLLGDGFCRGPKWTFNKWPIPKGRLTNQACAEECARKKGCTAYDISMASKGKFDCLLYGHKAVVPASGVSKLPAKCFVLKGSTLSNLLVEEDIVTPLGEKANIEEEEDDDTEGNMFLNTFGIFEIVNKYNLDSLYTN